MKLDPKYFDMVRIRGGKAEPREPESVHGRCQWKGCERPGLHRAPKGRGRDGEFYMFCADHVRQYNATYNYFDGMSDADIEDFQKSAVYGHRPTWKVAGNAHAASATVGDPSVPGASASAQGFHAWRAKQARAAAKKPARRLKPMEAKAIETLGLPQSATKDEIKTRFKELAKKYHPDANGGDRGSEEKLREIIQAYNYLKQVGLVS
ncbi:MAG: J domain-containing protein [Hyphomicrobiaceae bacterium]